MRVATAAAFLAGAVLALGGAVGTTFLTPEPPPPEPAAPRVTEADVRGIVQAFLAEKPDLVIDAIRTYQAREEKREADQRNAAIAALWDDLGGVESDPVVGNPQGDVTIVEFFDYRCGYCKRMVPVMESLLEDDRNVRVVLKEFPILGPESMIASRVALASRFQDRYAEVHDALMRHRGQLDTETIYRIVEEMGIDMERLRADMEHPEVEATLRRNMELADALDIRGTPAFVTRGEIVPGAVSASALKDMLARARKEPG